MDLSYGVQVPFITFTFFVFLLLYCYYTMLLTLDYQNCGGPQFFVEDCSRLWRRYKALIIWTLSLGTLIPCTRFCPLRYYYINFIRQAHQIININIFFFSPLLFFKKGVEVVISYHQNSVTRALCELFDDIALEESKFSFKGVLTHAQLTF